jgi:hypothetical protein
MKEITPRQLLNLFLTVEEQAQYAGVTPGTYKNATYGPAYKRYMRRALIQLIKDLESEAQDTQRDNKDFYLAAVRRAKQFLIDLRQPSPHSTG